MPTWKEIDERYEAIKDHKPRSSKKLKELGKILSMAYLKNPDRANTMWKYIIDLNIQDKIDYAQYYVAQVFRKLAYELEPAEATRLLAMDTSRVYMLIHHGYEGKGFYQSLYYVLGYAIGQNQKELYRYILDEIENKFANSITTSSWRGYILTEIVTNLFPEGKTSFCQKPSEASAIQSYQGVSIDNIVSFCQYCIEKFNNTPLKKTMVAYKAIITSEPFQDKEMVLNLLRHLLNLKEFSIFANFLFLEKEIIGDESEKIILDYLECSPQGLPLDYSKDDDYFHATEEEVAWYRQIVTDSPVLLATVYGKCNGYIKGFLEQYLCLLIETSEWKLFTKYFLLAISSEHVIEWRIGLCLEYIKNCVDYYVYGEDTEYPTSSNIKVAKLTITAGSLKTNEEEKNLDSFSSRLSPSNVDNFISALEQIEPQIEADKYRNELSVLIQQLKAHKFQPSNKKIISNKDDHQITRKRSVTAKYKGSGPTIYSFDVEEYLYYYTYMKVLFDLPHIKPLEQDKIVIQEAMRIVECPTKMRNCNNSDIDEALLYFIDKWINSEDYSWTSEDILGLKRELEKLMEYVVKYLTKQSDSK